ncbi:EexN family lipoprotein [Rhizobium leguminosarum bv. viciae]|uniref:EexN family lipoprotein n=1 Tax=Rhizobium leguminosarum bv. viciae TaxID=387 RepID=A0A8I2GIY5_RHILV|nr:EexN family lipoprotein [Rhizobium leguminosarum]MBY5791477.1 EexN family lipoprotein [Rhizobium leguminosarum]NKM43430.1 EexN family lipoprotein [Rhizobium leguminosarum bv. viciae]
MKHLLLGIVMLTLSGCFGQEDRIYTVDELMADEVLLAKITSECCNNPGALRQTPNCQNAAAADWKLRLERMNRALGG